MAQPLIPSRAISRRVCFLNMAVRAREALLLLRVIILPMFPQSIHQLRLRLLRLGGIIRMPERRNRQRGITVTEVLVAAALIGIALLCISPMLSYAFRSTRLSKERAAATQAAQRIIEQIQAQGFNQASALIHGNATYLGEEGCVRDNSAYIICSNDLQKQKLYIRDGDGAIATEAKPGYKLMAVTRHYHHQPRDSSTLADDLIQVTVKITWPGSQGQFVTMGITLARNGFN